jgi:hypothetical protein
MQENTPKFKKVIKINDKCLLFTNLQFSVLIDVYNKVQANEPLVTIDTLNLYLETFYDTCLQVYDFEEDNIEYNFTFFEKKDWRSLLDARKDLANAQQVLSPQNSDMGIALMKMIFDVNKMICQILKIPCSTAKKDTLAQSNFYLFSNLEKMKNLEINDTLIHNVASLLSQRNAIDFSRDMRTYCETNICEMLLLHI